MSYVAHNQIPRSNSPPLTTRPLYLADRTLRESQEPNPLWTDDIITTSPPNQTDFHLRRQILPLGAGLIQSRLRSAACPCVSRASGRRWPDHQFPPFLGFMATTTPQYVGIELHFSESSVVMQTLHSPYSPFRTVCTMRQPLSTSHGSPLDYAGLALLLATTGVSRWTQRRKNVLRALRLPPHSGGVHLFEKIRWMDNPRGSQETFSTGYHVRTSSNY